MQGLVIGYGEIGSAVAEVFRIKDYVDVNASNIGSDQYDVLHVSIPYNGKFVDIVNGYIEKYNPSLTIIHSTVGIGTTRLIKGNKIHFPIRGRHENLAYGLRDQFKAHVGYVLDVERDIARAYILEKELDCCFVKAYETTEAAKLLSLLQYGINIEFARYAKKVCDSFGVFYTLAVKQYTRTYNEGIKKDNKDLVKSILVPPDGKIGGHCVLPAIKVLNSQISDDILSSILERNGEEIYAKDLATLQHI